MAVNRTVSTLSIALIVFVMLTFILAVTTYMFFKRWMDEVDRVAAESSKAQTAADDLAAAKGDITKLKEIIGVADEASVADVEATANEIFQRDFAGFQADPRNFLRLSAWARGQFRDRATEARRADELRRAEAAAAEAARASEQAAKSKAETDVAAVRQQQAAAKQAFDAQWKGHEQEQAKLRGHKELAEEKVTAISLLLDEIDKLEPQLPSSPDDLQQEFQSKKPPEAEQGGDPREAARREAQRIAVAVQRIAVVEKALRRQSRAISDLNGVVGKLRAPEQFVLSGSVTPGSTSVQEAVLGSTPADDRVDGLDGRIVAVDHQTRSVLVSCPSTAGIRPGLVLHVYEPGDARPRMGDRKGTVAVTAVEGPGQVRAKIVADSVSNPLLPGDGLASSLWAAGGEPEVVIAGKLKFDGPPISDDARDRATKRLRNLVEQSGGRLAANITPSTAVVVDTGDTSDREKKLIADARKQYGVRVVGVDGLLDMLGLTRESLVP